jgi:hypothetical protein
MALASCTALIACLSAETSFGTSVLMQHDNRIKYLVSKKLEKQNSRCMKVKIF